ncbi:MAG: class I SAM-dependent methyltransferase [Bacteroidetes bacterium]|nr:class I SAM-dependent methyltransferase [Bacteroidota bacterium]
MKKISLLGHAAEAYFIINSSNRPADVLLDKFFRSHKYLGSHDRKFIAETVYGILRYQSKIIWLEQQTEECELSSSLSLHRKYHSALFRALLFHLTESTAARAQFALEIEEAFRTTGDLHRLIQKIDTLLSMAKKFESAVKEIAFQNSFPEWLVQDWCGHYGETETRALCSVMNISAPLTLRTNTLKISRDELQAILLRNNIHSTSTKYSPIGLQLEKRVNIFQLPAFRDGLFEVQDEGSQLLSLLVDPKPRSKVIDACAGAGGKSLALAAIMKNRGEIFAMDVHSTRLDELRKRIKRSGADIIRIEAIEENMLNKRFISFADIVLIDAPCSGTGTIRRNPGMKWTVTLKMIDELFDKQIQILEINSHYVKPNGKLVYATCSLMEKENQNVIERFLSSHHEFILEKPAAFLEKYNLATQSTSDYFQLLPHVTGTDGFFAAVLKKIS